MIVLTGFYNAEQYIERCLATIQSQDHKDFTCYITHDHSTDNSINLVKEKRPSTTPALRIANHTPAAA